MSFYEFDPIAPVKPGSDAERQRARLGAARMVWRCGGDATDLRLVLDALALWPNPPSELTDSNHM